MGQPGAKKMDQIVSVTPGDVHIIMVPSPAGPVPTPIPHPCNSIIKDGVAEKVKVMGQPGAVKGSTSQHTPPHIPMGPGPFQKPPANKGEIVTASSNVFYEGKEAAMLGDTGKMCADPSDAPVGKVMGTAATVLIGGGGQGSDADREAAAAAALAAAAAASKLLLNGMTGTGHPVDVATGKLLISGRDFSLQSALPVEFVRTYVSSNSGDDGPVGYGWVHNFQESIELIDRGHEAWEQIHAVYFEAGDPSRSGRYLTYCDPNGIASSHRFPEAGRPSVDLIQHLTFARDGAGLSLRERTGKETRFAAVSNGIAATRLRPIESHDRNGNRSLFRYDAGGRLTEVQDCYGRRLHLDYDTEGRRIVELRFQPTLKAPPQRWCSFSYDSAGNLVQVVDRAGSATQYAYADHLIVEDRNPDGYSFFFAFDGKRRCTHTWGQDGYLTRLLEFDPQRRRTRVTNGEGEVTLYSYSSKDAVTRTESATGHVVETVFDAVGRPVANLQGRETVLKSAYDDAGLTASIVDAEQNATALAHNGNGQVTSKTNPDGSVERFQYDARGNMTARIAPSGAVTQYDFDERGRVSAETHSNGRTVRLTYDGFGNIQSRSDGQRSVHWERDAMGNPLKMARSWAAPITYEWNEQGYVTRISEGDHVTARFEYNRCGDVTANVDDQGVLYRFSVKRPGLIDEYASYGPSASSAPNADSRDRGALLSRVQFRQDTEGRTLVSTDHVGRIVRTTFDADGRMSRIHRADGTRVELGYGLAGHIVRAGSVPGGTQEYDFDGRGLPTAVKYEDETADRFEYDEMGRLTSATNRWGGLSFEYDKAGRQISRAQDDFAFTAKIDPATGTVTWSWPEGVDARYEEDTSGRTRAITFAGRRFNFQRDGQGRLTACEYPNGLVQSITQDRFSRVTGIRIAEQKRTQSQSRKELLAQTVEYSNGNSQIASIQDERWGTRRLEYDVKGRLTGVERQGGASHRLPSPHPRREFYEYDDRENLVASHRFAASQCRSDQLFAAGDRHYGYDAQGRVSLIRQPSVGDLRFAYDAKGQVNRVYLPDGGHVEYRYDALGRRIEKRFNGGDRDGQSLRFFWDVNNPIKEELWVADERKAERFYFFTGLTPLARLDRAPDTDKDIAIFYHNDVSGRPQLCTDDSGNVVWEASMEGYGAEGGAGSVAQNFRMPGQYFDEETGLYYNRYRYYDPLTGRYLQPDPIVRLTDVNRYSYPTDPFAQIDPLGLETMILVAEPGDPVLTGGKLDDGRHYDGSTGRLLGAHPGSTDANMFDSTKPDLKGVDHVIINAHGSPGKIWITDPSSGRKFTMTGDQVGRYLQMRGFTGKQVTVVACDTGSSNGKFAQDLANELGPGAVVRAPTKEVSVNSDGSCHVEKGGTMKSFMAEAEGGGDDEPTTVRQGAARTASDSEDPTTVRTAPASSEATTVRTAPLSDSAPTVKTAPADAPTVRTGAAPASSHDPDDDPVADPPTFVDRKAAPPGGHNDNDKDDPPADPPPATKRSPGN